MKRPVLLLTLALFACSEVEQPQANGSARAADAAAPADAPPGLECAIGGGAFTSDCTIERQAGAGGITALVIRNASGGFRRLELRGDGTIAPADGAEPAENLQLPDGRVEVTIGGDRYRIQLR